VWSVAYAPDGQSLVSGDAGSQIHVWRAADTRLLQRAGGHSGRNAALAYRPDGKMLASAGDTTVRLWTVGMDGALRAAPSGPTMLSHSDMRDPRASGVTGVAWSPDGRLVASSGYGAESGVGVWLWNAADGRLLATIEGELYGPASLAWSRDGALLANGGGGSDGRVWLWDVASRRRVATIRVSTPGALAFSPDGSMLAVGQSGGVQLWQIER
jgi:WD40 repeat protein